MTERQKRIKHRIGWVLLTILVFIPIGGWVLYILGDCVSIIIGDTSSFSLLPHHPLCYLVAPTIVGFLYGLFRLFVWLFN